MSADTGARFPIVGLGASAGGIAALSTFFDHMPPDTGMAFVVILHLAPSQRARSRQRRHWRRIGPTNHLPTRDVGIGPTWAAAP